MPCIYLYSCSSYLYAICYFELVLSNYNCQFYFLAKASSIPRARVLVDELWPLHEHVIGHIHEHLAAQ